MKDTVSNQQLYEAIIKIHTSIDEAMDKVDKRITPLERTVDKIWIYWSMGVVLLSFVGTMTFDWIKIKFFRNL